MSSFYDSYSLGISITVLPNMTLYVTLYNLTIIDIADKRIIGTSNYLLYIMSVEYYLFYICTIIQ